MARRNFYLLLGVPAEASLEAIRAAYRALAKRHHPDRAGPESAGRFRELTEAYEILSDPDRRRAHDEAIGPVVPAPFAEPLVPPTAPGHRSTEPHISVRRAFDASETAPAGDYLEWTARHYLADRVPKSGRIRLLELDVVLTPDEAAQGGIIPIEVPAFAQCPLCGGQGQTWLYSCLACGGAGVAEEFETVHVRIPGRVMDGAIWELPLVQAGVHLRVHVRIAPHRYGD
jgi:hypothetical protein